MRGIPTKQKFLERGYDVMNRKSGLLEPNAELKIEGYLLFSSHEKKKTKKKLHFFFFSSICVDFPFLMRSERTISYYDYKK